LRVSERIEGGKYSFRIILSVLVRQRYNRGLYLQETIGLRGLGESGLSGSYSYLTKLGFTGETVW
jgi:hypothetical protein